MQSLNVIKIGALNIKTGDHNRFLKFIQNSSRSHSYCLGFLNPHVYNHIKTNDQVTEFLEKCEFVAFDGIGVTIPACILNLKLIHRIPMDYMFDFVINNKLLKGTAVLIGLNEEEISKAYVGISRSSAELSIVKHIHGFCSTEEYKKLFTQYSSVDYVLVGMGTPRSEEILLWANAICKHAVCWHIGGGTIRTWAGSKKRTPLLVSKLGCGWIHRIVFEPQTRNRYTVGMAKYLYNLTRDALNG